MNKEGALKPDITLQSHQARLAQEASQGSIRKLLVHGLGSGKSISSLGIAEAAGSPYSVITPAALRENFKKERAKATDEATPADVLSYSQIAKGDQPKYPNTLIFDEVQRARNPDSKQTQAAKQLAANAQNLVLLSGTPIVNRPHDLAPLVEMLTGQRMGPDDFERKFLADKKIRPGLVGKLLGVTPGDVTEPANLDELKSLLQGKVDWYMPTKPTVPVHYQDEEVEMSPEQANLYSAMYNRLPWLLRWKMHWHFPLSDAELQRARSFLVGPRQVGLSVYPYQRQPNALTAFEKSPKLKRVLGILQENLKDPRAKAIVYSNFIDAGLTPLAAALEREKIPFGSFTGKMGDRERKAMMDAYNQGKLRVALLGPAGSEGLSLHGAQSTILMDPHFQDARLRQAQGRGLRFDSHLGLDPELQRMTIYRMISRLPPTFLDRMRRSVGLGGGGLRPAADDYLRNLAAEKDRLNQRFLDVLKEIGSHPEDQAVTKQADFSFDPTQSPLGYAGGAIGALLAYVTARKALESIGAAEPEEKPRNSRYNPLTSPVRRVYTWVPPEERIFYRQQLALKPAHDLSSLKSASAVEMLKQIKERSDGRDWPAKTALIRQMIEANPRDWRVDGDRKGHAVGVTHRSGFRFHVPPAALAGLSLSAPEPPSTPGS